MSVKIKYHYTHFIYPIVIDNDKYFNFMNALVNQEKSWKLNIHKQQEDEEKYNFFLPYMRKFLFPTLFWDTAFTKEYKGASTIKKANILRKSSCVTFEYNLDKMKNGKISKKQEDTIEFDITSIRLICFEPGICFLDIKTEVEEDREHIDFSKILDFNHIFREMNPHSGIDDFLSIKAKSIDNINDVTAFIKKVLNGFETKDLEKIYYNKMFTYSYACVAKEDWQQARDIDNIKNDFYKFQYVVESDSSSAFSKDCSKLVENTYSRWDYSLFGFSRESGVVLVSEMEKYNITKMPYNFEKTYFYMLLLAFYQRISLLNFLQDLLKKDKTMVHELNNNLTKFTHVSWFSQITNSEHGMDVWKRWQQAFELLELYDEVHREYNEYYDYVVASGQNRINLILIIIYTVSVIFSGFSIFVQLYNIKDTWLEPFIIYLMILTALSYPIYVILRWLKYRTVKALGRRI